MSSLAAVNCGGHHDNPVDRVLLCFCFLFEMWLKEQFSLVHVRAVGDAIDRGILRAVITPEVQLTVSQEKKQTTT